MDIMQNDWLKFEKTNIDTVCSDMTENLSLLKSYINYLHDNFQFSYKKTLGNVDITLSFYLTTKYVN